MTVLGLIIFVLFILFIFFFPLYIRNSRKTNRNIANEEIMNCYNQDRRIFWYFSLGRKTFMYDNYTDSLYFYKGYVGDKDLEFLQKNQIVGDLYDDNCAKKLMHYGMDYNLFRW